MSDFIIKGPARLNGKVKISGAKNAALPIICATLLTEGKFTIKNVPEIVDIKNLLKIIESMGGKCTLKNNVCEIDTTNLNSYFPDPKTVRNIRASILLVGPVLSRFGKIQLAYPGGCFIGARPIDVHLEAFKKMGANIVENKDNYLIECANLGGEELCAEFSVTGTENIIMAAVLGEGETHIQLAASEPHVQDLCNFLVKAGAKIEGIGTHNLKIAGVSKLKSIEYSIIPDQIEAGTFAIAGAISKGEVEIDGFVKQHNEALISKFEKIGINYKFLADDKLLILPSLTIKPFKLRTEVYPGFATDLQAPMGVLATQANGVSDIHETIFEGRLNYINELNKMGANGVKKTAHEATITGPTPLYGTDITSLDLRAGATLIIAAIVAEGISTIKNVEIIDRGYEKIEEKLKLLGVDITRK